MRQKGQRFLPAETTCLRRNDVRDAFLHDVDFRSAGHFLEGDRYLHLAGQVRVVECVRVADAFVRHQFEIGSTEGMTLLGGKIRERHPVATADTGIDLVNLAREAMRRKPLDHRIGIEKGPIDPLGSGAQHSVKFNGVWHWLFLPMVKFENADRGPALTETPRIFREIKMAPVIGFEPVTTRFFHKNCFLAK